MMRDFEVEFVPREPMYDNGPRLVFTGLLTGLIETWYVLEYAGLYR